MGNSTADVYNYDESHSCDDQAERAQSFFQENVCEGLNYEVVCIRSEQYDDMYIIHLYDSGCLFNIWTC